MRFFLLLLERFDEWPPCNKRSKRGKQGTAGHTRTREGHWPCASMLALACRPLTRTGLFCFRQSRYSTRRVLHACLIHGCTCTHDPSHEQSKLHTLEEQAGLRRAKARNGCWPIRQLALGFLNFLHASKTKVTGKGNRITSDSNQISEEYAEGWSIINHLTHQLELVKKKETCKGRLQLYTYPHKPKSPSKEGASNLSALHKPHLQLAWLDRLMR